jgi:hypothetical protein
VLDPGTHCSVASPCQVLIRLRQTKIIISFDAHVGVVCVKGSHEYVDRSQVCKSGHLPLPSAYRFGLNRTRPPPVVLRTTLGGLFGKSPGAKISNLLG